MFTGIVQTLGTVRECHDSGDSRRLAISLGDLDTSKISLGDSIAVNGSCLTVTDLRDDIGWFDVSAETLSLCLMSHWKPGKQVNLETALTLQTPLGGHLVSGHVDGCGEVVCREDTDAYCRMEISVDRSLGKFVATKGSIAVDGVSLTVNGVHDKADSTVFGIMLIPHTLAHTSLDSVAVTDSVHIEIDQVARYVLRVQEAENNE